MAYPGAEVVVGTDLAGTIVVLQGAGEGAGPQGPAAGRAALRRPPRGARRGPGRGSSRPTPTSASPRPRSSAPARSGTRRSARGRPSTRPSATSTPPAPAARRPPPPRDRLEAVLAKTRIVSPIDGVVIARHGPSRARRSRPASKIVTIADLSRTRVEAELDEFDAGRVRLGDEVRVTAEGYDGKSWRGEGRGDPRRRRRAPAEAAGPRQARGHARPAREDRPARADALEARPARRDPDRLTEDRRRPTGGSDSRGRLTPKRKVSQVSKKGSSAGAPSPTRRRLPWTPRGSATSCGERLALYFRATFLASRGFFVAGFVIYDLWPPPGSPPTLAPAALPALPPRARSPSCSSVAGRRGSRASARGRSCAYRRRRHDRGPGPALGAWPATCPALAARDARSCSWPSRSCSTARPSFRALRGGRRGSRRSAVLPIPFVALVGARRADARALAPGPRSPTRSSGRSWPWCSRRSSRS